MSAVANRPKPVLRPQACKACGRCVEACNRGCLTVGTELHPQSGFVPVVLDLDDCTGCNLCLDACPEPHALVSAADAAHLALVHDAPSALPHPGPALPPRPLPTAVPDARVPLTAGTRLVLKGTHAAAVGALLGGCRHFFGYPITPSTEGAELMARVLPELGGVFVQAASEVAAVNMMYGCAAAGVPSMTFTSSPGFTLMLEGISYMIGAELPAVFVDVMRAGPGLGNIGPEQSDVKLACRGLGHGNTQAIVLAPATPQEMLDFTMLAFELSFRYRNPVVLLADGYLGQMTGRVTLPRHLVHPGVPAWAVRGDGEHRSNLVTSILLAEADQEQHNVRLLEKYARMAAAEQRAELFECDDAEILVVATNTPARMARGAVRALRAEGIPAGVFRPQTLWPFPSRLLLPLLERVRQVVVVEAANGQLEDELRLALSHEGAGAGLVIDHVQRYGGILPTQAEIVAAVKRVRAREAVAA